MARGTKLDFQIGAAFDEGWQQVEEGVSSDAKELLQPKEHRLVFKKEKRRGKPVTLVGEFFLAKEDALALLKAFKKKLGIGGTFKSGWMEFQGDVKAKLHPLLMQQGFLLKNRC